MARQTSNKRSQLKKLKGDLRKLGKSKTKLANAQIARSKRIKSLEKQQEKDSTKMFVLNDKIWRLNGKIDLLK